MATLDGDLNDSLTQCEPHVAALENHQRVRPTKKSQNIFERDREIGYLKNTVFPSMTNFSVRCMGYIMNDVASSVANGFLFSLIPKDHNQTEVEGHESDSG